MSRKLWHEHGSEGQAAPALLSQEEAAEFLGLAPSTLSSWRVEGRGPKFIRISGRAVSYRACDLETFISEREVQPQPLRIAGAPSGGLGQAIDTVYRRTPVETTRAEPRPAADRATIQHVGTFESRGRGESS
jgi:hypothetical protein